MYLPTYVLIIFPKQDLVFPPYIRKRKNSIILFFTPPLYTSLMVQNNASTNAPKVKYMFLNFPAVNLSIWLCCHRIEPISFDHRLFRHQHKRMRTSTRLCSWLAGEAEKSRGTEIITFRKHRVILYLLWIRNFVYQN